MIKRTEKTPFYGLMAEFERCEDLLAASRQAYAQGYRKMDAYSPFPVEELAEAVGFHNNKMALIVLVGGVLGCLGGYFLQYWISVIDYPLNIGGRPLHSWPSFIPVTFECTILLAAFAAVFGMLALNGLPQPYHPVFNVPQFEHASKDRFFLCIQANDPGFDLEKTRKFLEGFKPLSVSAVEH